MSEERDNIVVLVDDEGTEFKFEILDIIELNDNEYAVGLEADKEEVEDSEEETVLIMKIIHANDEEDILEPIEDNDELNSVFEVFKEKMQDEFEFEV